MAPVPITPMVRVLATATATGADALAATMTSTGADAILADATDKTDYKQFIGAERVGFTVSSCTAALALIAAGDVVLRSTDANANTDTLAVWATMPSILRSTAGKGYKLTSVKAFYRIYTGAATTVAVHSPKPMRRAPSR